jgi:hypothetical protein
MAIARAPVYMWAPLMPGVGSLRVPERVAGAIANRCAIGTSLMRPHERYTSISLIASIARE